MPITPTIKRPEEEMEKPRIVLPTSIRREVKTNVSQQIQQTARICSSFYSVVSRIAPQSQISEALKDASKGKILDVKANMEQGIYSMQITLRGRPAILTLRDSGNSFEIMLTDKLGKQIEYLKQEGNKVTLQ